MTPPFPLFFATTGVLNETAFLDIEDRCYSGGERVRHLYLFPGCRVLMLLVVVVRCCSLPLALSCRWTMAFGIRSTLRVFAVFNASKGYPPPFGCFDWNQLNRRLSFPPPPPPPPPPSIHSGLAWDCLSSQLWRQQPLLHLLFPRHLVCRPHLGGR